MAGKKDIVKNALKVAGEYFSPDTSEYVKNLDAFFGPTDPSIRRRLYTGTSKDKDFSAFQESRHGTWLTANPEEASDYAMQNDSQSFRMVPGTWKYEPVNSASRVIPTYARVENPYRGELPDFARVDNYKKAQSDWFDTLRAQGYDAWVPDSRKGEMVVVLKDQGSKVKSAIGNAGTFDLSKKNMNKSEGGSVKDEDSWLDAATTIARNAADKATFGTSKYAAAGADYLTDAALDALGYENDADFDRALAEQEYAMKEGEEKNPAAAGAGDIIGYVAPYLAIGPAEGALTTLGYLSDYGGKVGKTGSLFARALGFAEGGEVDPYADEVASAKNLMAEKEYEDQPWGDWAEEAVGNALLTAQKVLPTALGGTGEVGITDIARGAYEGGKDAVMFPGDVISGKQALYDEYGRPLEQAVGRSFNTASTVGGAASVVPRPANSLGVFGGTRSVTADKNALTKAQIMESQAASPDSIWEDAGWGRGAEGRWRYEMPDTEARVDPSKFQIDLSTATMTPDKVTTLGEYLSHPEVFAAYPEFKNMVVKGYNDPNSSTHGYYRRRYEGGASNPGVNDPYIALNLYHLDTPAKQRETLLHELQHAIQQKEGFAPGSNVFAQPDATPNPLYSVYKEALQNDQELKELIALRSSPEYRAEDAEKQALFGEYSKAIGDLDVKSFRTGVDTKEEYEKLTKEYFDAVKDKFPLSQRAAKIGQSLKERGIPSYEPVEYLDPFGAYEAHAGEVEARNVQNRMDMMREDLKVRPPWRTQDQKYPYEGQLIDWNNTSWRKGYAGRGRVTKNVVDEAVDLATRLFSSEEEDALNLAAREAAKYPTNQETIKGADLLRKIEGLPEDPIGYSKFSKPFSEMEYTVEKLPREPYKELDPYDLVKQNAIIAGHISDRTAAGRKLIGAGGTPLTDPLLQRGGVDYQRTTMNAWANRPGAAKGLNRKLNEAAGYEWDKKTKQFVPVFDEVTPVYTTPVFMGTSSANSSHMVGVPLIRMIPNLPISKADKLAFDAMMSERFPGWPGIDNTKAAEKFMYSGKIPGSAISRFIDYASAKKWRGAGFPDASEIMFASMDPRLVGVKQGSTGMGFKEFRPGQTPIVRSNDYHPDYPAAIPGGEYAGGFKYQTPQGIMFPDWWEGLKPELRLPENATKAQHSLMTQVPRQRATPEWADRVLQYWEKNPIPWGYADGGAVDDDEDIFDALRLAGETVSTGINRYVNPIRRLLGVETEELPQGVKEVDYGDLYRQARDADYGDLYRRLMEATDNAALYLGGADPSAKRPMKNPVSPSGKIVDRVPQEGADIDGALRIAKDVGGSTPVMMEDAKGNKYDAQGNVIPPTAPTGPNPQRDDSMFTNTAPENYKTDVQPFIDYAVTPIDRPGMPSEPDLVDVMRVATQVAAEGQPTDDRGEGNFGRRRAETVRSLVGASPEGYQSDYKGPFTYNAGDTANFLNTLIDFSPYGALEYAHDIPYEAGRTGDYGNAAVEGGLGALMTAPGMTIAGRGIKKGYEAVKSSPKMAAGIAGVAGLTASSDEAEAGPARWFSKAMEVAGALPMEKMTGEQALAMLRKGVSPEELKWTGTDKFLTSRPQVTKGELLEHLKNNRVQLNEVTLGGGGKPTRLQDILPSQIPEPILSKYRKPMNEALEQKIKFIVQMNKLQNPDKTIPPANWMEWQQARNRAEEFERVMHELGMEMRQEYVDSIGGLGRPTKYEEYSTAGGKGYRETLYQFGAQGGPPKVEQRNGMFALIGPDGEVMRNQSGGPLTYYSQNDADRAAKSLYRTSGTYQSPHWDDPNVLFHTRAQTLTYQPPGANRPYKVHNVEETQSDLAQAGRKRGFKDQDAMAAVVRLTQQIDNLSEKRYEEVKALNAKRDAELAPIRADQKARIAASIKDYQEGKITNGERNRIEEAILSEEIPGRAEFRVALDAITRPIDAQLMALDEELQRIRSKMGEMPLMPYVGNTEGWTDLAIKKELDRALDSDADYFSWSPGEVHAERYDLSKHIGKVQYNPDDGSLLAYNPQGKMVVNESVNDPSDLDEYLGKELADKMRAEADSRSSSIDEYEIAKDEETGEWTAYLYGEPIGETFPSKGHVKDYLKEMMANEFASNPVELAGLDLKVGGEGMLGYYNKIYLKRVQEVIKKATGIKPQIETITVDTADGPRQQLGIRITDEMREKARFSDFKKGGRVTGGNAYDNNQVVDSALALTREF